MSALTKLIDFLGLTAQTEELVDAMDAKDADNLQAAKSYADTVAAAAGSSAAASSIPLSQKGTPGGVAELNSQGIVPSHQLPSFVDDVIEGYRLGAHFYSDAAHTTIVTDETGQSADQLSGKIYVDLGDNQTYRWAGSDYAVISESLALGTTEATAGRGDWTYTAYQHALAKGSQFASNLYKITTNAEGHVIAATPVTKQDIVDLGIPGSDTVYEDATTATHGLMSASDKAKLDGVEAGAQVNPSDATQSTHGLMSATDKAKLDGVEANANNYSLPTMSASTKGGAKVGSGLSMDGEALNLGPLTASGSGASVQTDGCGIFGVTGEGWAEQDTTTGKNLVSKTGRSNNSSIISTLPDGGIKVYGKPSSGISWNITNPIPLNAGTYTLSTNGALVGNMYMQIFSPSQDRLLTRTQSTVTFTLEDNCSDCYLYLTTSGSNYSAQNTVLYPQLELGSTATDYEPYTGGKASPNPDYPQEIKVARGRNLAFKRIAGASCDGNGTVVANTNLDFVVAKVDKGKTYTATQDWGNLVGAFYTTEPVIGTASYDNSRINQPSGTFTAPIDGYFGFWVRMGYATPQLELGSTPTPYVPYGHVGLEVRGKNLLPVISQARNGITWTAAGNVLRFSGTAQNEYAYYYPQNASGSSNKLSLAAGTYTISGAVDSGITINVQVESGGATLLPWNQSSGSFTLNAAAEVLIYYSLKSLTPGTNYSGTAELQLELGSTATDYEPYSHTTTPIPLPAKGFLAALPDGTKDTLAIDSVGSVKCVSVCEMLEYDGSSDESWSQYTYPAGVGYYISFSKLPASEYAGMGYRGLVSNFPVGKENPIDRNDNVAYFGAQSNKEINCIYTTAQTVAAWKSYLASKPMTVLYELATHETESPGYIALPELPEGATVSIPELEAIGVEWWVEGAEAMAEHGRDVSKANKETNEEQLFKSVVLTGYSGSITETALYALHAELGTKSCLFNLSIDGVIYAGMQQGENVNAYSIMLFNNEKYIYAGYSHINSWTIKTISTI